MKNLIKFLFATLIVVRIFSWSSSEYLTAANDIQMWLRNKRVITATQSSWSVGGGGWNQKTVRTYLTIIAEIEDNK